ncbi:MAG: transglycosylase SLT domain-containing protein [Deltaproteobacteria bacterium]|nr:transglycosylase SLT domain-containing protein [Deltaproteobacteria bacterium]
MQQSLYALAIYFQMALLLAIGLLCVRLVYYCLVRAGIFVRNRHWLVLSQITLVAALVIPIIQVTLPRDVHWQPKAQVWSGVEGPGRPTYAVISIAKRHSAEPTATLVPHVRVSLVLLLTVLATIGIGIGLFALRLGRQRFLLKTFLGKQIEIRSTKKLRILSTAAVKIPFSTRLGGFAYVVVPEELLSHPGDYRLAVSHELQHHRQLDTVWIYLVEFLKCLFFWNPTVYLWARFLETLQEFACDEALIGRRCVSFQGYAGCLLRVAETAVGARYRPAGTTGMASDRSHLLRRVEMLCKYGKMKVHRRLPVGLGLGTVAFLASVAFASGSAVQDRTISLQQAQALIASAQSEIPLSVNELVLKWLNRFAGSPEGRKRMKEGIARMETYRPMIERKIAQYKMPAELIAVPLFESGYKNTYIGKAKSSGAGIWGFIKITARRYNLAVSDDYQVDERLNAELETDAAMRYLRHMNFYKQRPFRDWRLSIKGYNEGEGHVQKLINELGTRDPWELEQEEPREHYLSGAMAVMIILKNPLLLE